MKIADDYSIDVERQQTELRALTTLESQTREEARGAALNCARALNDYIRANPRLLYADTLPTKEAEELRDSLTRYVTTLRAMNTAPERVVVAVKTLVRDAAAEMLVEARSLTDAAVAWAIAAYFSPTAAVAT